MMPERGHQEQTVPIPHLRLLPSPKPKDRRDLQPTQAIVYVPPGIRSAGVWTDTCGEYVQRRGYRLAAVCSVWADVIRLLFGGKADVVVVGRRDHLPRDRKPRVEVVSEERADTTPTKRRPRRL